jgi:hypothetical protein
MLADTLVPTARNAAAAPCRPGQTVHGVPAAIREKTAQQYESGHSNRPPGAHARGWRAMLRRIAPPAATSFRD